MQLKRIFVLVMCFWLMGTFLRINCAEAKTSKIHKMEAIVTGYYMPYPNQDKYFRSYKKDLRMNGGGRTSSGTIPSIGTVAADKRVFPPGTVLHIPGYGRGVVEDTGGKIKGNQIDLFMGGGDLGRKRAAEWGNKKVQITVVSKA